MKPKTKIQKEVYSLHFKLPRLSKEQQTYIKTSLFPNYLYKTKGHTSCLNCGHRWENNDGSLMTALLGDECPKCKRKLKKLDGRKRTNKEDKHISLSTTVNGYQVFRTFYVKRWCKVGESCWYNIIEVTQHWINEKGKLVTIAKLTNPFNYGNNWAVNSDFEVRANPGNYYYFPDKMFPNKRVIKPLRRNGYTGSFKGLHPAYFSTLILTNPKAETLLKSKQIALFNTFHNKEETIEKYWYSIKVAIRHSYIIHNPSDWFDHLDILRYFDKDIHNPSVICLADFKTEHQLMIDRKAKIEKRKREEERKERMEQDNVAYQKAKKKYLSLRFQQGNLTVTPLADVQEFYTEAETMHHCVDDYHTKEHSLILSAQLRGKRLETIEVSLRDFTLLQCRGLQNNPTKHHKRIVTLVEQSLNTIKKASKSKAK